MEHAFSILLGILAFVGMQFVQFGIKHATASVTKKETRRDLEVKKIEETILEVRNLACEYWSLAGTDPKQPSLCNAIMGRITYVSMMIEELFRNDEEKLILVGDKYVDFFVACTGDHFLSKNRTADVARGLNIEVTSYVLIHNVATYRIYLSKWKLWQRA